MFSIFSKKKLDDALLEQLEEELIATDMGMTSVFNIIKNIKKNRFNKEITYEELINYTKEALVDNLKDFFKNTTINIDKKPFIILVSGTNGGGKTTSIAKLAYHLKDICPKILLVPCDTFRAGATDQLKEWSTRLNISFFSPNNTKDPAAIAYQGVELGIKEDYDVVIIDTSGRLDGNNNLMAELSKIENSIKKVYQSSPQESLLVIDGTQGQVALQQALGFAKNIKLSGIIITKLDSGAKGGILINVIKSLQIPIYFIGTGEKVENLESFNLTSYVDNLFSLEPKTMQVYQDLKVENPFILQDVSQEDLDRVEAEFNTPSQELEEQLEVRESNIEDQKDKHHK